MVKEKPLLIKPQTQFFHLRINTVTAVELHLYHLHTITPLTVTHQHDFVHNVLLGKVEFSVCNKDSTTRSSQYLQLTWHLLCLKQQRASYA